MLSRCFFAVFMFFLSLLASCAIFEEASSYREINIKMTASRNVNPDFKKKPTSVQVQVFTLSEKEFFDAQDAIDLFSGEKLKKILDNKKVTLVKTIQLNPNEEKTIVLDIEESDRFIAIIAGYRKIDFAEWKKIIDLKRHPVKSIYAFFDEEKIQINTY